MDRVKHTPWTFNEPLTVVTSSGNVGIGNTTPGAGLDVHATGANSALIVPCDTVANRPSTPVDGMIRCPAQPGFRFE